MPRERFNRASMKRRIYRETDDQTKMKAVIFNEHGASDVLHYTTDAPEPRIKANEILVEVRACALNHLDVWTRGGLPGIKFKLPHILGNDIAGIVRDKGELVDWLETGDEVLLQPGVSCGRCRECLRGQDNLCARYEILGYQRDGGYAEFVSAPAVNAIKKPAHISFEEAAALPLVTLTAWHMLVTRANVQPNEVVLIHAAGSGVGSTGIQIAKLRGARVIATASSDDKLEKALALGADETIDYTQDDWHKQVKRLTDGHGVDVVFEHTGAATWEKSILSLRTDGRLVTCGATSGFAATTDIRQLFYRHLTFLGSFMGAKYELLDALPFIEQGKIRAVIDQTLPLAEAKRAHDLMEDRAQFGKLVLVP